MNDDQPTFNRNSVKPIQCLSEGWDLIKGNYWLFMGIALVGTLIAGAAPFGILLGPMMCGIYFCLFRQIRGEPVKFEMLFRGFDYFVQSLIATLIMIVPMLVIIIPAYAIFIAFVVATTPPQGAPPNPDAAWTILGGMGLFYLVVFLVSIVISVLFFFTFPLIADRKMKGVQAVRTSIRAATANLGGVIGLVLLTQLMSFVGSLACCIGAIFVLPIHFAAVAVAYRKVFPPVETTPLSPTDGPEADDGPIQRADEQ